MPSFVVPRGAGMPFGCVGLDGRRGLLRRCRLRRLGRCLLDRRRSLLRRCGGRLLRRGHASGPPRGCLPSESPARRCDGRGCVDGGLYRRPRAPGPGDQSAGRSRASMTANCSVGSPSSAKRMPRGVASLGRSSADAMRVISAISSTSSAGRSSKRRLDRLVHLADRRFHVIGARQVRRRRQQRPAHVGQPARHPVDEVGERSDRLDDALALGDEVLLEVVDVGLQEVATGEQRLHLTLDLHPLGLAGTSGVALGRLDELVRLGAGGVEAGGGVITCGRQQPVGLGLGIGDGGVGGALGEQQRAADRLRLVDVGPEVAPSAPGRSQHRPHRPGGRAPASGPRRRGPWPPSPWRRSARSPTPSRPLR